MKTNRTIVSRQTSFTDWYTSIVERAELVHYSPIKGLMTFLPRGWALWEQIQAWLNAGFARLGVKNIALPSLFLQSDLQREKTHVAGFAPETFVVSQVGANQLTDPYVLRPTSETAVCRLWSEILQTYSQLPLLFNQWCSVFRVEKNTRPFLRNAEFHWQEAHGAYPDANSCLQAVENFDQLYANLMQDVLMIPVLRGQKTANERFAGGLATFTLEAIMPDGQCLQSATSHYLGQNFAQAFDIRFQDRDNTYKTPHTMSAGMSTRIIGALIMTHSDDAGLVLPFHVAPEQIALIPLMAHKEPKVAALVAELSAKLKARWRVWDNFPGNSLGSSLAAVEIAGVPLAIIVGPDDVQTGTLTLKWRTQQSKTKIPVDDLLTYINKNAPLFDQQLYDVAWQRMQTQIVQVATREQLIEAINNNKVALAPWAGSEAEEVALKQTTRITARCIKGPIDPTKDVKCFFTGKQATHYVYFGRAY